MSHERYGSLDLLLAQVREDAPQDDLFVQRVMSEVRSTRQRRVATVRRPMVVGFAAAAIVTGGAVAAFVGSNPDAPERVARPSVSAPTPITVKDPAKKAPTPSVPRSVAAPADKPAPVKKARGYLSEHTAYAFDAKTGLRMETETYITELAAGKELRVSVLLENTGVKPISFSAPQDCAMQVRAIPAGGDVGAAYTDPHGYAGRMEWACAGSDANPRLSQFEEKFVLEPGDRRMADAFLSLEAGGWNVIGVCRCTYKVVGSASPEPKANPVIDLFGPTLATAPQLPSLPESAKANDLATPPIGVRSR